MEINTVTLGTYLITLHLLLKQFRYDALQA